MSKFQTQIENLRKLHDSTIDDLKKTNKSSDAYKKLLDNLIIIEGSMIKLESLDADAKAKEDANVFAKEKLLIEDKKLKGENEAKRRTSEIEMAKNNTEEEIRLRELELKEEDSKRRYELEMMRLKSEERIRMHEISANSHARAREATGNLVGSVIINMLKFIGLIDESVTALLVSGLDEDHVVSQKLLNFVRDHVKFSDR